MPRYTDITVIYNPNSTGPSFKLADSLTRKLAKALPNTSVRLVATKRRGHAETLAYQYALASPRALIVSSSGDGTYNEVVNGLVRAQTDGATPVACLLPAGNANDHYSSLHGRRRPDMAKLITEGKTAKIDLLKLTMPRHRHTSAPYVRYAHSYIGLGLTPDVSVELNRTKLTLMNQMIIVAKAMILVHPVRIMVDGELEVYDSLVFNNVKRIAKYFSVRAKSRADDGMFEVTGFTHKSRLSLIAALLHARVTGLTTFAQVNSYSFKTTGPTLVQMDGEVKRLSSHAAVDVGLETGILECVV